MEGTRSALITADAVSGATYLSKNITPTSQLGLDVFINLTSTPSGEGGILWIGGASSARALSITIGSDLKMRLRDGGGAGGTVILTANSALSLNTWYRISLYATQDATNGTVRAAYFSGNSSTAIEDSTLFTGQNTGSTQYQSIRIGAKTSTGTSTMTAYFDNYGFDTAATDLLPVVASGPTANATASAALSLIDATGSTGTSLTYSISQVSGPTKTPVSIGTGQWLVPMDTSQSTVWTVTVTQPDSQTATKNVTVLSANSGNTQLVEMLYATGPGTFV